MKFFLFSKLFDMILCSFILLDYSLSTNPTANIENLLVNSKLTVWIFLSAFLIEVIISDLITGCFVFDSQYLEVLEPDEAQKGAVMNEGGFLSDEYSKIDDEFDESLGNEELGNTGFNEILGVSKDKRRFNEGRRVKWSGVKMKQIEIGKRGSFDRKKGLGVLYPGRFRGVDVKIKIFFRNIFLKFFHEINFEYRSK